MFNKNIWKNFICEDVDYLINCEGVIKRKSNDKIIKQRINEDGYVMVTLGKTSKRVSKLVHRLVAMYFVENPFNYEEVNHKDFNRGNPHYKNLEWMTKQQNITYSKNHNRYKGRFGDKNPNYGNKKLSEFYKNNPEMAKINNSRKGSINGMSVGIDMLDLDGNIIKKFSYIGECAEYLISEKICRSKNIDSVRSKISEDIKNEKISYYKYIFKKH